MKTLDIGGSLAPGEAPAYDKIGEVAQQIGNEALVTDSEQQAAAVNVLDKGDGTDKVVELSSGVQDTNAPVTLPISTMPLAIPPTPPLPPSDMTPPAPVVPPPMPEMRAPMPSSGRFMDVVHPSSDMRTPGIANMSQPPAMQAPVLPPAPLPVTPSPVMETPPVEMPSQPPTSEQMDPQSESTLSATEQAEAAIVQTLDGPVPSSPFLPNAQVEKRPLGNPAQAPVQTPVPIPMDTPAAPAPSEKRHIAPISDSVEAPSLGPEVSALLDDDAEKPEKKAGDAQKVINPADLAQPVTPEEQMLQGIESKEVSEADLESKEGESDGLSGSGGIDEVESGDTEKLKATKPLPGGKTDAKDKKLHDMYASSLHKPSAAKRKSGMLKIVLIVVIIIVGALMGVGAYVVLGVGK